MSQTTEDAIRTAVRDTYGRAALDQPIGEGGPGDLPCCSPPAPAHISAIRLGYSEQDLLSVPDGADLGLGCGNPGAIASLAPGETVLDLGSGSGFDAFLASPVVGVRGRVIGVDMTPAMVSRARAIADTGGYTNVEFRLGEIENLPVADSSVDVIISNCVINLSPDKPAVFREAFRVLRPGGRLAVSDVVASTTLPDDLRGDPGLYSSCIAGASPLWDLAEMMADAGFEGIRFSPKGESRAFINQWVPGRHGGDFVVSTTIEATKPAD